MKHFANDDISPRCTHRSTMQRTSCGKCPLPPCSSPQRYPEKYHPLFQLVSSCAESHPESQVGRQVSLNPHFGSNCMARELLEVQPAVSSPKVDIATPEDAEEPGRKPAPPKDYGHSAIQWQCPNAKISYSPNWKWHRYSVLQNTDQNTTGCSLSPKFSKRVHAVRSMWKISLSVFFIYL